MSNKHYLITTIDNPYSPFDDFLKWKKFDDLHNYGTCEKLGRLCITSENFTDEENSVEIENAVDEMISNDFLGMYKKAYEDDDFVNTVIPNPYVEKLFDLPVQTA